jgi:ribosomal protein S18 acetylase RimI-like enzyme
MSGKITYRDCEPGDVGRVLELWREAGAVPGSTDTEAALLNRLRRDPELFVLAFEGDRLVGCLMGGWDGWRGNMYRLVVAPPHRRKGIASELVRTVEARMRDLGAIRLYALAVKPELEPAATAFWQSMGYDVNPRLVPYVKTIS